MLDMYLFPYHNLLMSVSPTFTCFFMKQDFNRLFLQHSTNHPLLPTLTESLLPPPPPILRATARGFVKCGDCANPRVIYSDTAPRRMVPPIVDGMIPTLEEETTCQALAEEILKEACTSFTFVSGAMLYDIGHPFKEGFIT